MIIRALLVASTAIACSPACSPAAGEPSGGAAAAPPSLVIVHAALLDATGDALAIRGAKIVAIGESARLATTCRAGCELIDARGKFAMPGFHDAHVHVLDVGMAAFDVQTPGTTVAEVQDAVRAYAKANPDRPWIVGGAWPVAAYRGKLPSRRDLDAAEATRPVALKDRSGHQLWASSRALALAGITRDTKDPPGGTIVRDAGGEPSGILMESAIQLVAAKIPAPTRDDYERYIASGADAMLALGVTSTEGLHAPMTVDELDAYRDMERKGTLHQRTFLWATLGATQADFDRIVAAARAQPADSLVHVVAFKGFVDGVLAASTAAMLEPYAGDSSRGLPRMTQRELDALVARANRAGFPVALHAMGDRAVRMALDAFAYAERTTGTRLANRVEHATLIAPVDLPRFAKLGAIASIQPNFTNFPSRAAFPYGKLLGAERAARLYAWKDLVDAGATVIFGSDHPHGGPSNGDPITGLHCATTRELGDGSVLAPEQRLDPALAVRAYTAEPARAIGRGDRLGKLAVGYDADIIVLDHDPRNTRDRSIADDPLALAIVAGRVVVRASGAH